MKETAKFHVVLMNNNSTNIRINMAKRRSKEVHVRNDGVRKGLRTCACH